MKLTLGALPLTPLLLATCWAGAASAAPAERTAPEYTYQVTRKAGPYQEIPGLSVNIHAEKGQPTYLWARDLRNENVTDLGSGDNIGSTFALYCRNADGSELPGERGTYWAANLVPPGEKQLTPTLRYLFVAPETGDYTCVTAISSYSSIIQGGREVVMRIPAGASLAHQPRSAGSRWTLPIDAERTIGSGESVSTLGFTYTPKWQDRKLAIVQDANLTTCLPGGSPCDGGSSGSDGVKVRTQVVAQPQHADGTPCGSPLTSEPKTTFISHAKHHLTSTNTLYATKSDLGACAKLRVNLELANLEGNPVMLHAGESSKLARSHGVAFEY